MMQQDAPDDFVIATGVQVTVREFLVLAAKELGIILRWEGKGVDEVGIIANASSQFVKGALSSGQVIVRVDPRYFRPTEVATLLGDPTKAREKLGWFPKTTVDELAREMVLSDLEIAKRDALVKTHGYKVFDSYEW